MVGWWCGSPREVSSALDTEMFRVLVEVVPEVTDVEFGERTVLERFIVDCVAFRAIRSLSHEGDNYDLLLAMLQRWQWYIGQEEIGTMRF